MEFRPQDMVRLKSDKNQLARHVTEITAGGRVRCAWHEPGNDNWIGDWFDPSELELVPPGS
jgi:uncharacterized protein YodC (DUF2158 family)